MAQGIVLREFGELNGVPARHRRRVKTRTTIKEREADAFYVFLYSYRELDDESGFLKLLY